jgi:hypothetical protein
VRILGSSETNPTEGEDMDERYTIVVRGRLDAAWDEEFGALRLARNRDGTTTLSGPVPDQCALHGHLGRIQALGLTLVSVHAGGGPR